MDLKEIICCLLTEEQIIKKATDSLGLGLCKGSFYHTSELKTYELTDPRFADALRRFGFKINNRVDNIITLSDENPQPESPGVASSGYWNFRKNRDALRLGLRLICRMNYKERGVIFSPYVQREFLSSSDTLSCLRFFRVVAEYDKHAPALIRQVAQNEKLTVSFTAIGLSGIRSLAMLFEEFRCYNDEILQLANSGMSPFNPSPSTDDALYAPEYIQASILELWKIQLNKLLSSLEC